MKSKTPLYDQLQIWLSKCLAHGTENPDAVIAEATEKYINTLIDKAKVEALANIKEGKPL